MNIKSYIFAALWALSIVSAEARLGETKEECIARYKTRDGVYHEWPPRMPGSSSRLVFSKDSLRIDVEFDQNGRAWTIMYQPVLWNMGEFFWKRDAKGLLEEAMSEINERSKNDLEEEPSVDGTYFLNAYAFRVLCLDAGIEFRNKSQYWAYNVGDLIGNGFLDPELLPEAAKAVLASPGGMVEVLKQFYPMITVENLNPHSTAVDPKPKWSHTDHADAQSLVIQKILEANLPEKTEWRPLGSREAYDSSSPKTTFSVNGRQRIRTAFWRSDRKAFCVFTSTQFDRNRRPNTNFDSPELAEPDDYKIRRPSEFRIAEPGPIFFWTWECDKAIRAEAKKIADKSDREKDGKLRGVGTDF